VAALSRRRRGRRLGVRDCRDGMARL
jgi:hypothetical protein